MNLEILTLSREVAIRHKVFPLQILSMATDRKTMHARRELWAELHRRGCRQADIARAWGCAEHTVADALDLPVMRGAR